MTLLRINCGNNAKPKRLVTVALSSGPLSSVMTNRFGFQVVVMLGGLLVSVGTIATSFTNSINQMYITYGLIAGIAFSIPFTTESSNFIRIQFRIILLLSSAQAWATV